ncbi:OLC1v1005866C1 [Oldenlandia corymbosa var. corymbosa]|uniref:OLC1v1005866C1 n=1 Tax=Oldenlandia corymbosa var. corymbosa TaxID=529605 RepID=A0AAV1DIB2_OLDCO|nr:OLC1v1005866C1 [Oldenlandia corymbosa var. corymbosa]
MALRLSTLDVHFLCFISLILVSVIHLVLADDSQNDGVYIVYTGAAASSFHSDHIMSSSSMESWKERVIHTYSSAFSGFAARLSKAEAELIAQRPEVVSVFPDRVHRLQSTRSWDFLRSQSLVGSKQPQIPKKSNASSVSGEDVIIGMFDSGI